MANFIDHRMSQRASRQFRRVTQGRTEIVQLANGHELRDAKWKFKRMKFSASYAMLDGPAQQEVTRAFYAADAMNLLFRFRDYGDHKVEASPLTVEVGTKTPVQLVKRYTFGPKSVDRPVQAVAHCVVSVGGVDVAGVLDNVLGLFTPTDNWASGAHTWTGVFDLWVRFASDDFDMTMETLDIAVADVEFIEARAMR